MYVFICISGVVLGHEGGMLAGLVHPVMLYAPMIPIGSGKQWFPWIHVQDLASMIVFAIENDKVTGVLNGVAPQSAKNMDFTKAFCKAFHKISYGPLAVPGFAMDLVYGSDRAKMVLEGQRVVPERPLALGFQFSFPDIDGAMKDISLRQKLFVAGITGRGFNGPSRFQ